MKALKPGILTPVALATSLIAAYQPTTNASFPTGYVTNWLFNAIKQITFSGKAVGQKVPSASGMNPNAPFPRP